MKYNSTMSPCPIQFAHSSNSSLPDHSKEVVYVSIQIPTIQVECTRGSLYNQNDLKAWVWEKHKDKLYENLQVRYEDQNKSPQSPIHNEEESGQAVLSKPQCQLTDHKEALVDCTRLVEQQVQERTEELRKANERLVEANRQVGEAAAVQLEHFACMSREIRTPLNCILGLSSLLQEMKLPPSMQESMDMILSSGQLLLSVVNDVLDYAKLTSGNVEIESVESSSQEIFDTVVSSLENDASTCAHGITISTKYDPALPMSIITDPSRLQQILYNLMGNAVKFSKKNGEVALRVEVIDGEQSNGSGSSKALRGYCFRGPPAADETDSISLHHTKRLRLSIKDHGKGIEKSNFKRIFQPLPQSNTLTVADREFGGTGLGLAITAKLVHRLGGSISVDSELGKWTEFTVDLPLLSQPADVKSLTAGLSNVTVLLVDSDLETISHMVCVFSYYKINLLCFQDMDELRMKIILLDKAQSFICIIREDLYKERRYSELCRRVFQSALVMTGPEYMYGVMESKMHFHSLSRIIPSVLVKALGETLETTEVTDELEVEQQRRPANMSSLRVLIAEDNVVNLKVLRRILERIGIRDIDAVGNGKLAVENEASREYDVVFMDMQMPVMDGIDACRLINGRKGGHPKAKIVFVTAHIQDSFKTECLEAGAVGFLGKPFTIYGIENCLDELWE